MFKIIIRITVLPCVLILACGVAVGAKKTQPKETKNVSEPLMILEGILEGISSGDYVLYSRYFSEPMRASQKREDFLNLQKNLQKSLGKRLSLELLGSYVQRGNIITLFKAKFSKDKDDVLIKLILEGNGPQPKVVGLWFDSPVLEK